MAIVTAAGAAIGAYYVLEDHKRANGVWGSLSDPDSGTAIEGARIELVDTKCHEKTGRQGYFEFTSSNCVDVGKIRNPRLRIFLPGRTRPCTTLASLNLTDGTSIQVDARCRIESVMAMSDLLGGKVAKEATAAEAVATTGLPQATPPNPSSSSPNTF